MTNTEYKDLYQAAQLKAGTLTNKTRLEILKAYKQAANLAADAVKDATERGLSDLTSTHWQNIENQLKAGATIISNKITTEIPLAISKAYANVSSIDEDFIMDAVKSADNTVITTAGIKSITASINTSLITASASRIYETGYTLTESIWNTFDLSGKVTGVNGDYQYRIKNLILTGQAQGRDAVSIAKDIQVYVAQGKTAVFKAGRYGSLVPGTAEYAARISSTVDWRALRIVRTELYASLKLAGISEGDMNPAATGMYDWNKKTGNPIDINGSKNTSGKRCVDIQSSNPHDRATLLGYGQNHVNCGCTITPELIDHEDFVSQLSTWEPGSGGNSKLDTWYRTIYSAT